METDAKTSGHAIKAKTFAIESNSTPFHEAEAVPPGFALVSWESGFFSFFQTIEESAIPQVEAFQRPSLKIDSACLQKRPPAAAPSKPCIDRRMNAPFPSFESNPLALAWRRCRGCVVIRGFPQGQCAAFCSATNDTCNCEKRCYFRRQPSRSSRVWLGASRALPTPWGSRVYKA